MERKILRHPDFGTIEAIIENGKWWFFSGDIARIKYNGKFAKMTGNDSEQTRGIAKKFPRVRKDGLSGMARFLPLSGVLKIACHAREDAKKRTTKVYEWLSGIIKEEEYQTLFSKIQPFTGEEPRAKTTTPNIYDCIETTRNDLTGKMSELQGVFDTMLAKWKDCVDTGLRYKSERDSAKADPQKVESLEYKLARLKVILGMRDLRAKRSAYDQLGQDFPINGKSPLHEPQEIAKYFGITSQELNDWLVKHKLQERVANPSWGDAKYKSLPTALTSPLAQVIYREEEKGQKFYHLQWKELGLAYIIGEWICELESIEE